MDNFQVFGLNSYVCCVLFIDMENMGKRVGLLSKDIELSLRYLWDVYIENNLDWRYRCGSYQYIQRYDLKLWDYLELV